MSETNSLPTKLDFHVGGGEAVVEEVWRMRNDWVSEVPSSHEDLHQMLSEPVFIIGIS